ncbi:flocculation protein FLO11-like [Cucumis melo var. makuwa]|uniref:Flocculation protein FLO11-like n=1 Tax=Cucumis melo var. makuwa TaxID=1194695 RepID=A0A5D3CIJ2_CUCMM|nr:flocculation protein FLO11-like [Cucumis melo var. makuwa]
MTRVMMHVKDLPIYFWAEALNTACHIHNRVTLRPGTVSISYELGKGRKLSVKYFHVFRRTSFILSDRVHRRKWDSKSDRGIFLGYSMNSRAYRIYNQRTRNVKESINVIVDNHEENNDFPSHSNVDSVVTPVEAPSVARFEAYNSEASDSQKTTECSTKWPDIANTAVALTDEHWLLAMQDELLQFERNQSAFLIGYLSEEVYVAQPKGFVDSVYCEHVYKLCKALYGLKQAPRAWYERLSTYLLQQGYKRSGADQTMFMYRQDTEFLIVQIYVDEIIFGAKYAKNLISKFGMDKGKPKRKLATTHLKLTKDTAGEKIDQACIEVDPRTSHLHNAKHILKSIAEPEYIAVGSSCSQLLWMKQMLEEYGVPQSLMILYWRSSNPVSLVTVKRKVSNSPPPPSFHQSTSSVPRTRGLIEMVVLDFDSSDNEDNVVLSTLLQRKTGHPSKSSSTPLKSTQVPCSPPRGGLPSVAMSSQTPVHGKFSATSDSPQVSSPKNVDVASDETDEDYVPTDKETPVPDETTTSIEDRVSSPENHTKTSYFHHSWSTEGTPERTLGADRGISFHSKERTHKWKYVMRRQIVDEANISYQYSSCLVILDLIRTAGLLRTVSEVGTFYPRLIRELIVNLPSDFNDPSAKEFHKVYIRGVCFHISHELLNQFLGITLPTDYAMSYPTPECLAAELTGGTMHIWPVDG